jgi:hypothetical protein
MLGPRVDERLGRPEDDDGWAEAEVDRAPICPVCGVTALPAEAARGAEPTFVCENPDCDAFGEPV